MAERNNLAAASQGQEPTSGAERTAEEIRQDIAARRESISETVDRLSDRFQRTLDWRAYVSDYPLAALGIAAGAGFLASRVFKRRPTPGERMKEALAYGFEDLVDRFRHRIEDVAPHKPKFGLGKTVKAAAVSMVAKGVTDYLQAKLAGGQGQYGEYIPEYMGGYPAGDIEYPGTEPEGEPRARKKGSEPPRY